MPLFPLPIEQFPGLNLVDDPSEVGFSGVVDTLNVDLDGRGRVRSRDGFAKFTTAPAVAAYHSLGPYYKTDGTRQLIAAFGGASGAINALNTSGGIVAAQSYANSAYGSIARFAAPGSEHAYVAVSQATGAATVYRWDGATWTTPTWVTTTPTGRHLATWQNRLVNARRAGTTNGDSPSSVRFSNITPGPPPAADPLTWNANDFVELSPGDGEEITALIAWRDSCFAFKESKFFVFYGVSTDSTGNAVFNYRPVYGQGLASAGGQSSYRAVASAPDGVYFLNRRGVWFTSGGPPTLVSAGIDPIFRGNANSFYLGGVLNQAAINAVAMTWHDNRLFVAFPSGSSTTNDKVLVFDPKQGYWLLWNIPTSAMSTFRIGNVDELALASSSVVTVGVPSATAAAGASAGTLTPSQDYFYKVTALNAAGETTGSTELQLRTAVILTPTGVVATSDAITLAGRGMTVGTYFVKVTAVNSLGETVGSSEVSGSVTGNNRGVGVSWNAVAGASGYRVYITDAGGSSGGENKYAATTATSVTLQNSAFTTYVTGTPPNPFGGGNTTGAPNNSVALSWPAIAGATSYRVYRGTTAGGENVFFAPGNVLTFTDTGGAGTAGTVPVTNTATTAGFDVGRYNITSGYIVDGGDGLTTGASITCRYQSGFDNIAPPRRFAAHYLFGNTRKRLRKWKVTGSGSVSFDIAHDFGAVGTTSNLTLGASPAIKDSWHNIAGRGQLFSYRLTGSGPWTVTKLTAYLAGSEPPLLGNPSDT